MTKIICISGKQGSGKTTIAKELQRSIYGAQILKFADPLYEIHDAVNKIYTSYGVKVPEKDGYLLQWIGTEHGRATKGEDVWVNIMKTRIKRIGEINNKSFIITDDCRFVNEFDMLKKEGALMVRLVCPTSIRETRCDSWRKDDQHPSEIGLDRYECTGKFDLILQTEVDSVEDCVQKILGAYTTQEEYLA